LKPEIKQASFFMRWKVGYEKNFMGRDKFIRKVVD
jgi:hypothetical protein